LLQLRRAAISAAPVLALAIGYWVGRARAGVPSVTPLFYAGTVEDGGGPLTGAHTITVRLWDAASAGNALCAEGPAGSTTVNAGRFRVALDVSCVAAVHTNGETFIEVKVDGTALPRSKVGAVPYALEAGAAPWSGISGISTGTEWPGTISGARFSSPLVYTRAGKSYSVGGSYCGATATSSMGSLGGYAGAKTACESACAVPTAHMCTSEELIRFVATGGSIPAGGWFAAGFANGQSSPYANDCVGWTYTMADRQGPAWSNGNVPTLQACNLALPVLCCN
jgi:hypothetical protein